MFAVIETGGKQYRIAPGQKIRIEKLRAPSGGDVVFDKVLLISDGEQTTVGAPHISGAKVHANVVGQGREEKKIIFKYHSKTRYRKKKGHRQPFTEVRIGKIVV